MNNLSLTKKIIIAIFLFLMLYFTGCWEFLSIEQPEFADPNSTFEVPIMVTTESNNRNGTPNFGILIPIGWSVKDSITYSGIHNGILIYSDSASDAMQEFSSAPAGYYWWVAEGNYADSLLAGTVSLTPQIITDNQTGTFLLEYVLANGFQYYDMGWTDVRRSGYYPISVNAPATITVTNTNESGDGSLRKALNDISIRGEILFDLSYPATINLDSQLVINRSVTITGPEQGKLIISGDSTHRVIHIWEHLAVNISNLEISGGNGGILCNGSELNLKNILIKDNHVKNDDGGGLYCEDSEVSLKNVKIIGNSAIGKECNPWPLWINGKGGGLVCRNSNLNFSNVTIANNTASTRGGGVLFEGECQILFDSESKSNIYSNSASLGSDLYRHNIHSIHDPVIHIEVDTFSVLSPTSFHAYQRENFTFNISNAKNVQYDADLYVSLNGNDNNSGMSEGEALKTIKAAFSMIIVDSLNPNKIYLDDGIYSSSTNGEVFPLRLPDYVSLCGTSQEKVILDAENQAAVIEIYYPTGGRGSGYRQENTIEYLTITRGSVGGISCWESILNLKNVTVTGNTCICNDFHPDARAGIYCENSILNLSEVNVDNNSSDNGGGIRCNNTEANLSNVTISNNRYSWGGGISSSKGTLILTDVKILNNSAGRGGGINCYNTVVKLANVTIAHNYAEDRGGGIIAVYRDEMNSPENFIFDKENRCNIYSNSAGIKRGADFDYDGSFIINVIVDTFTVLSPTRQQVYPLNKFTFDILHDVAGMTDINNLENIPTKFALHQNYPNPFNPKTTIEYTVRAYGHTPQQVNLSVYNLLGQKVTTLVNKKQPAGSYQVQWDATSFATGVYYYKLTAGDYQQVKKMVLIK
jgi:predicted outer membrane repeat protein